VFGVNPLSVKLVVFRLLGEIRLVPLYTLYPATPDPPTLSVEGFQDKLMVVVVFEVSVSPVGIEGLVLSGTGNIITVVDALSDSLLF